MSAVDVAVQVFRELEPEDLRVLLAIELGMSRHRYAPEKTIPNIAGFPERDLKYRLPRISRFKLIRRWKGPYTGYVLTTAGYDCLAINALVKANIIEAFGKPLGVGKEADVYDALTPEGRRIAVKFHMLGRTSFRQTRRTRQYVAERRHISWLYQSRLAAEKEYEALKLVSQCGVAVPEPIAQNRHVVAMSLIEGAELVHYTEIPEPEKVLDEILLNMRKCYLEAGVIHADLSEFNIILKPDWHIFIIDWPQYVKKDYPNAEYLLKRDVQNVTRFFERKFNVKRNLKDSLAYVKGTAEN